MQPLLSLFGQTIFLQAAVELSGNSHFDQPINQCWLEVTLAEGFSILQIEGALQGLAAHFALDIFHQVGAKYFSPLLPGNQIHDGRGNGVGRLVIAVHTTHSSIP